MTTPTSKVFRQLRSALLPSEGAGPTDGQLLEEEKGSKKKRGQKEEKGKKKRGQVRFSWKKEEEKGSG
jgi:hypothetical protein